MPKRTPIHSAPGLAHSSEQTIQQLIRLLDESRAMTHLRTSEHFDRALGIWLAALQHAKLAPWLDACAGMEKALGPLQKALALLMMEAQENSHDLLGTVYMRLAQGDKRLGQYFTPYGVAKMMAEMQFHDFEPPAPGARPITVYEPTCGSGIMILAAAEVIEERFPGSVLRGAIQFFGIELDPVCVRMAQLNMLLHHIGRITIDHKEKPDELVGEPMSPDQAVQALFQPAKIIQGNALDPDIHHTFFDEARFPWFPITVRFGPGAGSSADEMAAERDVLSEQQRGDLADLSLVESRETPVTDGKAEEPMLFALSSEVMPRPAVTLQPALLPATRSKRRTLPPLASTDFVQQELFPL